MQVVADTGTLWALRPGPEAHLAQVHGQDRIKVFRGPEFRDSRPPIGCAPTCGRQASRRSSRASAAECGIRHDKRRYRERWRIEATFKRLKDFRRIHRCLVLIESRPYDKDPDNALASVKLAALRVWLRAR